jgi:hypothetical protein
MKLHNTCRLKIWGISPQCGFSSTSHGNNITMDDQWKKLQLVVKLLILSGANINGYC